MEIEIGDIIKTTHRRLIVVTLTDMYVVARDMDFPTGNEEYIYESVIRLCAKGTWSLKKATKQLDMSALEEL